jgi:Flp pilus assembly protein TadD
VNDILSLWIAHLESDAPNAVADALSGRTSRGALQHSDADEFFVAALTHAGADRERVTESLDRGLLQWLKSRHEMIPASIAAYGTSALISQLDRALLTVARARLPMTAQWLIDDHLAWDEWLTPLRRRDWIDVVDSFDEALALNQQDDRLLPRWFGRLADAGWGGSRWEVSLRIGLAALRKIPHPAGTRPESRVTAGLVHFVRHAIAHGMIGESDISRVFQREAMALTEMYPRRKEHWQEEWTAALQQIRHVFVGNNIRLHEWLHGQLFPLDLTAISADQDTRAFARPKSQRTGNVQMLAVRPPTKEEREALLRRLASSGLSPSLWRDVRRHVERHRRYAEASGEGNFVVLTVTNFGSRLLRTALPEDALLVVRDWILGAMSFAPDDPYLWDLWAKLQDALGRHDDALAVLWETVRRFPDNVVVRNRLGVVLREHGRTALAEGVLREAIRDFPGSAFTRRDLAELLRETERLEEAEQILHETMREFPRDDVCRGILAMVLRESGREEEAEKLMRETIDEFPQSRAIRSMLAELLLDTGRQENAEKVLRSAMRDIPQDPTATSKLALLMLQEGKIDEAEGLLTKAIDAKIANSETFVMLSRCRFQLATQAQDEGGRLRLLREARENTVKALRREGSNAAAIELHRQIDAQLAHFDAAKPAETIRDEKNSESATEESTFKDDSLRQESESFLRLNVARGNEFAEWYSAAHKLNGSEKVQSGANEFQVVTNCVTYENENVVLSPPAPDVLDSQPGSYSLRILEAYGRWRSTGQGSFTAEVAALGNEFPHMRNWNDSLRIHELNTGRRLELMKGGLSRQGENEDAFWSGRLLAIYPELDKRKADAVSEQSKQVAFERLVADVAIACAARSEPRVGSISSAGMP